MGPSVRSIAMRQATAVSSASAGLRTRTLGMARRLARVLDGLVGGAVLADEDRVVGEDVDDRLLHEGGEAEGGAQVVGEDEEGRDEGPQASVEGDAVGDGGHAELADAEVDVAAAAVGGTVDAALGQGRDVGAGEVGRAADEGWARPWRRRRGTCPRRCGSRPSRPWRRRAGRGACAPCRRGSPRARRRARAPRPSRRRTRPSRPRAPRRAPCGASRRRRRPRGRPRTSAPPERRWRPWSWRAPRRPRAEPWTPAVPCLPGEPLPMTLFRMMRLGRSASFLASATRRSRPGEVVHVAAEDLPAVGLVALARCPR